MDTLDWSKTYPVLSFSRLSLNSAGLHYDLVAQLTDEDMQRIADILVANHFDHEFEEEVLFTARLVLAEKGSTGKHIDPDEATEQAGGERNGTLD